MNKQNSGNDCTNIQSSNVTIIQGVSESKAQEIAMEVYLKNAEKYASIATETVIERVKEISNELIEKFVTENKELLNCFREPDFQYAFLDAQRGYSRRGTPELKNMLINLLREKAINNAENTKNLILNESIKKVSRLSNDQINLLTFSFLVKHSVKLSSNPDDFASYIKNIIFKIFNNCTSKNLGIRHLEYHGCYSVSIGSSTFYTLFKSNYSSFFSKGFPLEDFIKNIGDDKYQDWMVIPCFLNPQLVQINAVNEYNFKLMCEEKSIPPDIISRITSFHNPFIMNENEFKIHLEKIAPGSSMMMEFWDGSLLKNSTLTTVGMAIAISHLYSLGIMGYNYDTWLCEK